MTVCDPKTVENNIAKVYIIHNWARRIGNICACGSAIRHIFGECVPNFPAANFPKAILEVVNLWWLSSRNRRIRTNRFNYRSLLDFDAQSSGVGRNPTLQNPFAWNVTILWPKSIRTSSGIFLSTYYNGTVRKYITVGINYRESPFHSKTHGFSQRYWNRSEKKLLNYSQWRHTSLLR